MEVSRIHQLSEEVIGQIAAGEVVERPSSAVKELVENAMDAGATAISVEIRDGGTSFLKVTDNGKGILPQDIRLAFARHATSKIRDASDIYGVKTLGFRGEALASIAAVSRVQLVTRSRGNDIGVQAVNEAGIITDLRDAACPEGTSITVKDLFFNAPVRLRFLRKPAFETAAVSDLIAALIISHPEISFRFKADGKTIYFSAGDGTVESAVLCVFGLDVLKQLKKVSASMSGVMLDGYVGVGELARGNRSRQYFFLNGRLMKSGLLSGALENACRQRVMIGRFPICMLYLTMPYENVDVNVHPNKWEVRFSDEKGVRSAVETMIFDALTGTGLLSDAPALFPSSSAPDTASGIQKQPANITVSEEILPEIKTETAISSVKPEKNTSQAAVPSSNENALNASPSPKEKQAENGMFSASAGILGLADLLKNASAAKVSSDTGVSAPDDRADLYPPPHSSEIGNPSIPKNVSPAIDSTSVHPELMYSTDARSVSEKIRTSSTVCEPSPEPYQQNLLEHAGQNEITPDIRYIGVVFNTYILLEYQDRMFFCDQHAAHERLLYERLLRESEKNGSISQELLVPMLISLSPASYAVYSENISLLRKAGFDSEDFGDLNVKLLGVPVILGQPQAQRCFLDALDELARSGGYSHQDRVSKIMQTACKHAIKGGEAVNAVQLTGLIRKILKSDIPPTCPHGRPLFIEVTRRDLEKRFKRIQD